jgi:hypothetical protein
MQYLLMCCADEAQWATLPDSQRASITGLCKELAEISHWDQFSRRKPTEAPRCGRYFRDFFPRTAITLQRPAGARAAATAATVEDSA